MLPFQSVKVGCAFRMVVVSLLPLAEFGPDYHHEDALHITRPQTNPESLSLGINLKLYPFVTRMHSKMVAASNIPDMHLTDVHFLRFKLIFLTRLTDTELNPMFDDNYFILYKILYNTLLRVSQS